MKSETNLDIALLLVRVAVGVVFLTHGWLKFTDMESTLKLFSLIGLSASWAYAISAIELLGGLSMILGLFTDWFGIVLALETLCTMLFLQLASASSAGYQLDLVLFLGALAVSLAGPGKYAVRGVHISTHNLQGR